MNQLLDRNETKMKEVFHYPVMHREIIELLDIKNKKIIVDCTAGLGSHALKIAEIIQPDSYYIGIDKDEETLKIVNDKLTKTNIKFSLVKGNFSDVDGILKKLGISKADVFLFDLGISMYQLTDPERGFSFMKEGPLDMRMDRESFISAYDLVNNLSEFELENIFRKFGEEKYARRVAHVLVEKRREEPISSTTQLTKVILSAMPHTVFKYKIHPATRIFQALRIAVNRELEALKAGIEKAINLLSSGGRIGVISFHSLEDRIVKHTFKEFDSRGILKILTKKPITPGKEELVENIASRSGKLRVAEKI
ncbi:MAG: 16S rRNA (cytosine(1402)-N(4))-methyltransferase RsmH [Candidatus Omnitrophica bacterium]|jgi:16S rRNA (cytosine1402-N4)-methyltransferase|nr:16S rRNA (cytosine(1402)-N(4))-methyltransferase RsmH [Candidatus Omnitrophota bacterium]